MSWRAARTGSRDYRLGRRPVDKPLLEPPLRLPRSARRDTGPGPYDAAGNHAGGYHRRGRKLRRGSIGCIAPCNLRGGIDFPVVTGGYGGYRA
jgi:hypothetical protein